MLICLLTDHLDPPSFPTRRSSDLAEKERAGRPRSPEIRALFFKSCGESFLLLQQQKNLDRKSTRLNSSHRTISYAVFCLKKKKAAYANLHTDQERDYFMQRYHDVISSFGGKTSYDADNRPLLVMRSNLWASGYDVDGPEQ